MAHNHFADWFKKKGVFAASSEALGQDTRIDRVEVALHCAGSKVALARQYCGHDFIMFQEAGVVARRPACIAGLSPDNGSPNRVQCFEEIQK